MTCHFFLFEHMWAAFTVTCHLCPLPIRMVGANQTADEGLSTRPPPPKAHTIIAPLFGTRTNEQQTLQMNNKQANSDRRTDRQTSSQLPVIQQLIAAPPPQYRCPKTCGCFGCLSSMLQCCVLLCPIGWMVRLAGWMNGGDWLAAVSSGRLACF